MAILRQMATLILREHRRLPIKGTVVTIGRQSVALTRDEANKLLIQEGVPIRDARLVEVDEATVGSSGLNFISDRSFFSMFSEAKVLSLDVSAYEGADIVHDLNTPLPSHLRSMADFIYNGSCLDNLFDPASAIKAMSQMLRPCGRIIHAEHGSPIQGALICYSPEWFFNFYAVNDYVQCVTLKAKFEHLIGDWRVIPWKAYAEGNGKLVPAQSTEGKDDFVVITIATKGRCSTDDKTPIQGHYRVLQQREDHDLYLQKFREFTSCTPSYAESEFVLKGAETPVTFQRRIIVCIRTLLRKIAHTLGCDPLLVWLLGRPLRP